MASADPFDLDGRIFDMVSSTAGPVDAASPTRFRYSESNGVVWGEYAGDTVSLGRFVGTRDGSRLEVSFVHDLVAGGRPASGTAVSRIERADLGLRLVEDFEAHGKSQVSICAEVRPAS